METNVDLQSDRRKQFRPRTIKWCWIAAITVVATIGTMLVTGWRIGSPELLVVTATTLFFSWLIVGILQSRGKFRILSMLVVCAIVAILSSTLIPRMRVARAHKKLVSKVMEAGGVVLIAGHRNTESNGWVLSGQGIILPKIFAPLTNYLEGGVVEGLTIPVDLIDDEMANNIRFSKTPQLFFVFKGVKRNYKAIEKLIRASTRDDYLIVQCSRLQPDDAKFLSTLGLRILITYTADAQQLNPVKLDYRELQQVAIMAKPTHISLASGVVISEEGWEDSNIKFKSDFGISLNGQQCNAAFINALNSSEHSLTLSLAFCQLSDEGWTSLSELDRLHSLALNNCGPTEIQLLELRRCKTLRILSIIEPKISDSSLQELSKVGSLVGLYLPFVRQRETLRCFLENNPKLSSVSFPCGVLEGTSDTSILTILRAKLETQLRSKALVH